MAKHNIGTHLAVCKVCGKEFQEGNTSHLSICPDCRLYGATCPVCGKKIPWNRKFCSYSCNSKHNMSISNPMDDPANRQKISNTLQEHYGEQWKAARIERERIAAEYKAGEPERRRAAGIKAAATVKAKGILVGLANPEIREKIIATAKAKNGGMGLANPAAKEKARQTNLAKYGVENPAKSQEIKDKIRKVQQERYGGCGLASSYRDKIIASFRERYGVENPGARRENLDDRLQKAAKTKIEKYGTPYPWLLVSGPISSYNKELGKKLENLGCTVQYEYFVGYYSYDLLVDNKLLIEINPTVTHNDDLSCEFLTGRAATNEPVKHRHKHRWSIAAANGFELVSIFDWQDSHKVFELIKAKLGLYSTKIGARKCSITEITAAEASAFYDKNHVLGAVRGCKLNLALTYEGLVVSVMSFGEPRSSKDGCQWELLRFANLEGYSVSGAASKLFQYFLSIYSPDSILTFTDNNLGNGSLYTKLGFQKQSSSGDVQTVWCTLDGKKFVKNTSLVMQGADRLLQSKVDNYFPVGLDKNDFERRGGKEEYKEEYSSHLDDPDWWPGNVDIMRHYGFVRVLDCGSSKFIWKR